MRVDRLDQLDEPHLRAVERDRPALLELDLDVLALVGCVLGVDGHLVGVLGRRLPRVFEDAALVGAAPEVLVDRVGTLLGQRHRHVVPGAEVEQLAAAHVPGARRGEALEVRVLALDADLDADLVVALAGAAVGDGVGAVPVRRLDELLGDQRPRQRRDQRVLVFVERVGHQRRQHEVLGELLLGVDDDGVDRPGRPGALHELVDVLDAADVDQHGDRVETVLLLEVRDHGCGVESAGVGEDGLTAHCVVPFVAGSREARAAGRRRGRRATGDRSRGRPAPRRATGGDGVRARGCLRARPLGDARDTSASRGPSARRARSRGRCRRRPGCRRRRCG